MYKGKYSRKQEKIRGRGRLIIILLGIILMVSVLGISVLGLAIGKKEQEPTAPPTLPSQTAIVPTTESVILSTTEAATEAPTETPTEAPTGPTLPAVSTEVDYSGLAPLFKFNPDYFKQDWMGSANYTDANLSLAPFRLNELFPLFSGNYVHHINILTYDTQAIEEDKYITVSVVNKESNEVVSEHRFYARAGSFDSTESKFIVSLYSYDTVYVRQNETLAFSKLDDPLKMIWTEDYGIGFYDKNGHHPGVLYIDVYVENYGPYWPGEQATREVVEGKTLSILGDGISSFEGWSNSIDTNDTLGKNKVFYTEGNQLPSVQDTWWMRTAKRYDMKILVNNSWEQSTVTSIQNLGEESWGWNTRPDNLHDNTLADNPDGNEIQPDFVVVCMGANDLINGAPCDADAINQDFWSRIEQDDFVLSQENRFEEAYARMIYKIQKNYPNATIFCFNIPRVVEGDEELRKEYNLVIKKVVDHYGSRTLNYRNSCYIIDLYCTNDDEHHTYIDATSTYAGYSGSRMEGFEAYTLDGIHPNSEGMELLADILLSKITSEYGFP